MFVSFKFSQETHNAHVEASGRKTGKFVRQDSSNIERNVGGGH